MHLLLTRPHDPSGDPLAAALEAAGHRVTSCPLLSVEAAGGLPDLGGVQALIVTSKNALRVIDRRTLPGAALALPLFAVGQATAAFAERLGFQHVIAGQGGARDLAGLIRQHTRPEKGALVHLAGDRLAFDLAAALAQDGFEVRTHVVYRTAAADTLPDAVRDAARLGQFDGIVLMSPHTAKVYARLIQAAGVGAAVSRPLHFCLSDAVAEELRALGSVNAVVAEAPNSQEMLALIARRASDSA